MKNIFYIILFTLPLINLSFAQDIWINEFSYNSLNDVDEFIEIVAPVETDMSQYGLVFYNYNGSFTSNSYNQLSGSISSTNSDNGKGYFVVMTHNSSFLELYSLIPNGITTQTLESEMGLTNNLGGILLINNETGEIIHGVCYELQISNNPPVLIENKLDLNDVLWNQLDFIEGNGKIDAIRLPLVDGSESTPNGSISMIGTGFSRFWTTTAGNTRDNSSTPGNLNFGQGALPVELSSFTASVLTNGVKLFWRTATEINNYGFEVERCAQSAERKAWEKIGFVNGNGNSNSPKDYSFVDNKISDGKPAYRTGRYSYRLKQIDNDGQFEYSKIIEVDMNGLKKFELSQNYPNPFNPATTISFSLPEASNVKLTLYNLLGQEIETLVNGFKESGVHTVNFNASKLNSGIYIYKIETNGLTQTRKMTLVK